ncbi:hypothetical protein HU230_0008445 [Bradyrhizobium quebecense]|uniref:Uncharacterized protein n=1 Tax=Bradyrhizobium quebecense TaxID=2748629 RepID=A0A974ADL7_9BRAD|nr:hypothetical protein [Bradyrhizobium quebecense]UGA46050.1 hypothetical protein HU230_0008445 [Bradyrhizobium quebecense]
MSSLSLHGGAEVTRYMPDGTQDAGSAIDRAASRFAIAAQDVGVRGNLKPASSGLTEITTPCVSCRAGTA